MQEQLIGTVFLLIKDLERMTGEPRHRLNYALSRYGPPPAGTMGNQRYWRRADFSQIEGSLRKTAAHFKTAKTVGAT